MGEMKYFGVSSAAQKRQYVPKARSMNSPSGDIPRKGWNQKIEF